MGGKSKLSLPVTVKPSGIVFAPHMAVMPQHCATHCCKGQR